MRHVPTDHPATPFLHVVNASLKQKITTRAEVGRLEGGA